MKIGVIGGGQLGMMLGQAAGALGHECIFVDPSPNCSASAVGEVLKYEFSDEAFVEELVAKTDIVTYEFENVDFDILKKLSHKTSVHPSIKLLSISQDRLSEKTMLGELGFSTAPFLEVSSFEQAHKAAETLGYPFILKTCRFGYDGKGQVFVHSEKELEEFLSSTKQLLHIAEGLVAFDYEVSKIATRTKDGSVAFYPLTKNIHRGGILRVSVAPLQGAGSDLLEQKANTATTKLLEHYDYVGTLAVEFFVCGGELVANEIAPRVHNSGHWTLDGGVASQFENHIRALTGMSLGVTATSKSVAMVNVIGEHVGSEFIEQLGAKEYDYRKSARPGRKLAHFNLVADTPSDLEKKLKSANLI